MPTYDNATTGETEVTMNSPPIRIPTQHLVLRAARAEDARILFDEYTGNVQASEFLPRGPHTSQSTTEKLINAWAKPPGARPAVLSGPSSTGAPTDRSASSSCSCRMTRRQKYITDWDVRSGDMASQPRPARRSCSGSASDQHYPKSAQCAQQTTTQAAAFWKKWALSEIN